MTLSVTNKGDTLFSRNTSTLGALHLNSSLWELRQGQRASSLSSISPTICRLVTCNCPHICYQLKQLSVVEISYSYRTSNRILYLTEYISQNEYLIHHPSHGGRNHKPKLVSYIIVFVIYGDISNVALYGILYKLGPTLYHYNVSLSHPKPIQNNSSKSLFNLPHKYPCWKHHTQPLSCLMLQN